MLTILAGLERVKPSGTEVPEFDQGPTSRIIEAKTYPQSTEKMSALAW